MGIGVLGTPTRTCRIGLDVGRTAIRAAQVVAQGNDFVLVATASRELAADGGVPGGQTLAESVRACLSQATFRTQSICVGMSSTEVEFHALEVPSELLRGEAKNVADVVRFEVERLTALPGKGLEVRHWNLPTARANVPNVIAVAADGGAVCARADVCRDLGKRCQCVDASMLALVRLASALRCIQDSDVWGVLDIGFTTARLTVCAGSTPVLMRSVGAGTNVWTDRIADSLHLSKRSAEVQRREHGIAAGKQKRPTEGDSRCDEVSSLILAAVRTDLTDMALEVKRSYEYALTSYAPRTVADLLLVGGGGSLRGLAEFLEDLLGIPVRCASSYLGAAGCRLECAPEHLVLIDRMAAAIGLSMEPAA